MNTLPCKKLFIQQIKNSKIISKTNQPQCMYSVELDPGRYYHYTKVWIQGSVTDCGPFHEEQNEAVEDFMRVTISDGTGNIDVLYSNLIKEKNMMHKCAFDKGKNLLVTGTVMQVAGHEDTCIKAARLFEIKHFCKEEWVYEVKRMQCYLTALQ